MQTHATAKQSESHASRPFFNSPSARSPFFSPRVQAKLTMGAAGDPFEREADAVAERVVQRMAAGPVSAGSVPSVQAACAACEDRHVEPGEGVKIQAKTADSADTAGIAVDANVESSIQALPGGGSPLPGNVRSQLEPQFDADFSGVRVHSDSQAHGLARSVNAHAFTVGQDIVFAPGRYAPHTTDGTRLLAHELTHVVQQAGGAPAIQRDEAGGGSTEFTDSVNSPLQTSSSGVISGEVTRMELAPSGPRLPGRFQRLPDIINQGTMNIAFDPSTCSVTVPFGYRFVEATPTDPGPCDPGPAPARMSTTAFNNLKAGVLRAVNTGLNGWYDVELSGGGCPPGCSDRRLPIRVVATENNSNPNTTITVHNRAGRSDEATICALSWGDSTAVHEGGHQVFGVGNEYLETDESMRDGDPEAFRPELVRRDYSVMGPESHSRFAMFHERHFNAVKVFLEHAFPDCEATLLARARPVIPDFRVTFDAGFAAMSGLPGFYAQLGLNFGIPLDRLRRWEITLGPEFTTMLSLGDQRTQAAFLMGARLGLEGSTGDAGFGMTGGPFISAGYGWFHSSDQASGVGSRDTGGAFGEVGGRVGIRTELDDYRVNVDLESAGGSVLGAPGIIGAAGPEIASDPARTHWFRVGVGAALQF